jgi:hypothetical protein
MDPLLLSFAGRVFFKLNVALTFAAILALASNSTLAHGLHYFSAICLLMSLWLFAVGLARRRPLERELSEWDEGLWVSLTGVGAHFLASLLSP